MIIHSEAPTIKSGSNALSFDGGGSDVAGC